MNDVYYPKEMVATMELRWLNKSINIPPFTKGNNVSTVVETRKVLQQKWVSKDGEEIEWRDIPEIEA